MTISPYTILDPAATPLVRLVQQGSTTLLQAYGPDGCAVIELDAAQLAALLRALPRAVVLAALGLHDPEAWPAGTEGPGLAHPAGHVPCPTCGACTACERCACAEASLTLDLDPDDDTLCAYCGEAACEASCTGALVARRPTPGTVCACDQHAGVHVADAACGKTQEDVTL